MVHSVESIIIFFGIMYIVGPILIRFSMTSSARPEFHAVNPATFPPELAMFMGEAEQLLRVIGFQPTSYVVLPKQSPNVTAALTYLVNRSTGDKANITAVYVSQDGSSRLKSHYVEFCTHFSNGDEICTNTNSVVGSFKHGIESQVFRFPQVEDLHLLYALHDVLMERFGRDKQKVLPNPGEEILRLSASMVEGLERQVRYGMLYLDQNAVAYRPTWKGAVLMTWGQLWPVNAFRRMMARRRADQLLKDLGPMVSPATMVK